MINNNAMNLQGASAPYLSLIMPVLEVVSLLSPKVWFHNRDKLLFITLHNQLGKYVEWLHFPVMHIRFALGPAEHD
jgi:hypothetical protein